MRVGWKVSSRGLEDDTLPHYEGKEGILRSPLEGKSSGGLEDDTPLPWGEGIHQMPGG